MWTFQHTNNGNIVVLDGRRGERPIAVIKPDNQVEFLLAMAHLSVEEARSLGKILRAEGHRREEIREDR